MLLSTSSIQLGKIQADLWEKMGFEGVINEIKEK